MRHKVVPLVLILVPLLAGCAGLRQIVPTPSASIESADVAGVSFTGVTLRFQVNVTNPYGSAMPLIGLDYTLASRGNTFLKGDLPARESIPAGSSSVIPMDVTLPFQALRDIGETVRPGAEIPYRADLGIKVDAPVVGVIRVPAAKDGTLLIPSFP